MSAAQEQLISILRGERWCATPKGPNDILLGKVIAGRGVTVVLVADSNRTFHVQPVTYSFKSRSSHFDYTQEEIRYTRNKNILYSLIDALHRSKAAAYISNLDHYLKVNEANQKSNKGVLNRDLKRMLSWKGLPPKKNLTRTHFEYILRGSKESCPCIQSE